MRHPAALSCFAASAMKSSRVRPIGSISFCEHPDLGAVCRRHPSPRRVRLSPVSLNSPPAEPHFGFGPLLAIGGLFDFGLLFPPRLDTLLPSLVRCLRSSFGRSVDYRP